MMECVTRMGLRCPGSPCLGRVKAISPVRVLLFVPW